MYITTDPIDFSSRTSQPGGHFRLRVLRYPCVAVANGLDPTTQCREECRPIKRNRLPSYRGELSNVIALNQLLPLAKKHSVWMLERTVRRPGAR